MIDLTDKQIQVLAFIKQYIEKNFRAPSVEDVRKHFGFLSRRGAGNHMIALVRKGKLTKEFGKGRSYIPVGARIVYDDPVIDEDMKPDVWPKRKK